MVRGLVISPFRLMQCAGGEQDLETDMATHKGVCGHRMESFGHLARVARRKITNN